MSKTQSKRRRSRKKNGFKSFIHFLVALSILIILAYVVRSFIVVPVRITGDSMANTYNDGDIVLATRFDYLLSKPDRGDVVLCSVRGREGMYVKRVIGLPGDMVEIANGTVTVNGEAVYEDYVTYPSAETQTWQLDVDQYMVLGDNRLVSYDSREADMGMLSKKDFAGKVRTRVWPLGK